MERLLWLVLGWMPWFYAADVFKGPVWSTLAAGVGALFAVATPRRFALFGASVQTVIAIVLAFSIFTLDLLARAWLLLVISGLSLLLQWLIPIAERRAKEAAALELARQLPPPDVR